MGEIINLSTFKNRPASSPKKIQKNDLTELLKKARFYVKARKKSKRLL